MDRLGTTAGCDFTALSSLIHITCTHALPQRLPSLCPATHHNMPCMHTHLTAFYHYYLCLCTPYLVLCATTEPQLFAHFAAPAFPDCLAACLLPPPPLPLHMHAARAGVAHLHCFSPALACLSSSDLCCTFCLFPLHTHTHAFALRMGASWRMSLDLPLPEDSGGVEVMETMASSDD